MVASLHLSLSKQINLKEHIVVFTNTLLSGGAEKQALLLANVLSSKYQVILVIYHGEKVEAKFQAIIDKEKINTVYLSGNTLKKTADFYQLLKKNNVHFIFSYLLTTNFIGALTGILVGVKYRIGGIRNAQLDAKKLPIQRFIHNHLSSHTIFNNYTGLAELTKKGFKNKYSMVIANGFDLTTAVLSRAEKEKVTIITVGRFVPQKGYSEAFKAMLALKNENYGFSYLIIGYGELEQQIREEVQSLNLSDEVKILINPDHISECYKTADIYLCSSIFEGLSNTIMEALSFSLPVVATPVGDNHQLVKNGENGFITEDTNHQSFINPLKELISSSELRNKMGAKSYQLIKDQYSVAAFTKKYEDFINQNI